MDKLLVFPGRTDKGVFNFVIDTERSHLVKTAAEYHPTVASYIASAKKIPGKTQLLLTALGAGEWWGDNSNSDWFGESELAHPGKDYGYETFLHYAKVYKHHVNKDPNKSYGDVLLAVYNPIYHRVELIVAIDHDKAPDIIEKIENGEVIFWSMGCLPGNAKVLMGDFTLKNISEVVAGDKVINASGNISTVSYPHTHHHKGRWYKVSVSGISEDAIPTTEEHPWLVKSRSKLLCKKKKGLCTSKRYEKVACKGCKYLDESTPLEWKRADELEVGDYVGTPIIKGDAQKPEDRYAFLGGLYLAEGHITTKGNRLVLTVSSKEYGIYERLVSMYPDNNWIWRPRENTPAADIECALGTELCNKLIADFGEYAPKKVLSPEVMRWPVESQKIFVGAYHSGDGCTYKGAAYFSTCNKLLADQIFKVLLRIGCIPTVNTIRHKPSTIVRKETTEYQTRVGSGTAHLLSGYSTKIKSTKPPKCCYGEKFIEDGYLWSRISNIEVSECDEQVYNIAIDSGNYHDDSYVVENVALHNCKIPYDICSICGNKAPTRKHYCEHLRYQLGQIDPKTGKKVYAINIRPKFFDISYVTIPADKTAYGLKKVANLIGMDNGRFMGSAEAAEKEAAAKSASQKKVADILKEVPAEPPSSTDIISDEAAAHAFKTVDALQKREHRLPNHVLDRLCDMGSLPQIISTMISCAMFPKPQEFQRIFLISQGMRALADQLDKLNVCFNPHGVDPSNVNVADTGFDTDPSHEMADALIPYFAGRSYSSPLMAKRMVLMVKNASEYPVQQPRYVDVSRVHEENSNDTLKALGIGAAIYAAIQVLSSKNALSKIVKFTAEHPMAAASLASGLVGAAHASTKGIPDYEYKGRFSGTETLVPETTNLYDRHVRMEQRPYIKEAAAPSGSLGAAGRRLFLWTPMVSAASDVAQKLHEANPEREEGVVSKTLRKHKPLLHGLIAADAFLALQGKGSYRVTNPLAKAQSRWLKGEPLFKAAGVVMDSPSPEVQSGVSGFFDQDIVRLGYDLV